jgi:uncharacterized protein YkwD
VPTSLADGRAPIVRVALLSVCLAVAILFASTVDASASKRSTHRSAEHVDRVEAEVIDLLNTIREEQGLPTLRRDSDLTEAAYSHSRGMIESGVFSHDSASGTRCDVRIRRFVKARSVGETISWLAGTPSSEQAHRTVELWMNSPPHRETLLTKSFRRIGVSRKGGEMFGRRGVAFTADLAG